MGGDLLPILASWTADVDGARPDKVKTRVALACLELLVPLTWPLETAGEMTNNHHRHTPYLQQAQVLYKAGILSWENCDVLRQVVRIGLPSIATPKDERATRDEGIIKLVLYFLRNVAVIRQVPNLPSQGLEMEVSRSATIEAFVEEDVFALLLTMCSNMGEDFSLHDVILLEILFNLIKGVDVKKLWMTKLQRKDANISELSQSLAAESAFERNARKTAPSRHGRFGTMIWVKRDDNKNAALSGQDNLHENKALFNMDQSKKWSKPKTKQKDTQHTIHDFNRSEELSESATEKLRNFVEEFLDSGFNPLFTHLRKAIEREAERLLDVNYRQFFFCVSWFLEAERCRRTRNKNESRPADQAGFDAESYGLVAAVLNQETFILLNRYMQNALDSKDWQDLNACMRCFTQILLTVQEMAISPLEDDQEIAENIQNRIFYEETTHDRIVGILRGYKDQGFGYLDACTELSHTFLRMLERYSKENADLQIRSRRRARQKKKDAQKADGDQPDGQIDDDDSEREDAQEVAQVSRERKFDFNRFAAKFVTQQSINTYVSLMGYYKELDLDQLKRAHRFFYRAAFKQDAAILLYRVDIIALFYRTVQGADALNSSNPMAREWSEFCKQLFKKMTKKLDERPELLVEMLFSKVNSTLYYLEYGHEKQTSASVRPPAELEIRTSLNRDVKEQIGIVVTILVKDDKINLVLWLKSILQKAVDERSAWALEAEARKAAAAPATAEGASSDDAGPETTAPEAPLPVGELGAPLAVTARPTSDDIRTAMFKNARLRLLMKLCGLQLLGEEDVLGAPWIVPATVAVSQLREAIAAIEEHEFRPWQSENPEDEPEDMLRRVPKPVAARDGYASDNHGEPRRDNFIDDSEGEEDFEFPDNVRTKSNKKTDALEELKKQRRKRKRASDDEEGDEADDDAAAARRRARRDANDERRRKIKSELYVRDSDDETDEEADKAFFTKEEEIRKRQEERVRQAMTLGVAQADKDKKKGRKSKTTEAITARDLLGNDADLMDLDGDDDAVEGEETADSSSQPVRAEVSDEEDEAEDTETPLSSQSEQQKESSLKELRQPRTAKSTQSPKKGSAVVENADESDEDDEQPVIPVARRRAGFIIDSDDDE